jgi:hypothetical protein
MEYLNFIYTKYLTVSLGQRYCSYYSATYLANTEMAYASNDNYTKSDLRAKNTLFDLKSDGFFSYESGW